MQSNIKKKLTGVSLALAAAGLFSGCQTTGTSSDNATAAVAGKVDMVHCYDVNQCKGHNDCKTADNACAGHGACKGKGFVATPASACANIGGKRKDNVAWQMAKADLVHCYNVNACKGHNDCKTASNACAGHGSCEGKGFVALPAGSCSNIGGKVG